MSIRTLNEYQFSMSFSVILIARSSGSRIAYDSAVSSCEVAAELNLVTASVVQSYLDN